MKLNIQNPIIFFDLETTGVDVAKDRIVELCYIKIFPNGNEESKTMRINPGIPIPKHATEVHGINDEDVQDCPAFKDVAAELFEAFKGCDLAGFNSNKFDVPMLVEEFLRVGVDVDLKRRKFIDVQNIFFKMESRTLVAAYKFYCGKSLDDAHSAEADTLATCEVLEAQLDRYPELENDVEWLAKFSQQRQAVDFAGFVALNDKDVEVFTFGQHKGKSVEEVFRKQHNYYDWIMQSDFPAYTKKVLTEIYLRSKTNR